MAAQVPAGAGAGGFAGGAGAGGFAGFGAGAGGFQGNNAAGAVPQPPVAPPAINIAALPNPIMRAMFHGIGFPQDAAHEAVNTQGMLSHWTISGPRSQRTSSTFATTSGSQVEPS